MAHHPQHTYALKHGVITLNSASPTLVLIDDVDVVSHSAYLVIQNIDEEATVFLGASNVSSEDFGYAIGSGGEFSISGAPRYPHLYAISSVEGSKIAVMRMSS
jgi:hypothetical protein